MNARLTFRLLAAVLLTMLPARLPAQAIDYSSTLPFRTFVLDLMEKNVRDRGERTTARLAREEALAHPPSLRAASYDLNHDGKLDDRELAAWTAALRQFVSRSPEGLRRFDRNHDGRIDDAEWAVVLERYFNAY